MEPLSRQIRTRSRYRNNNSSLVYEQKNTGSLLSTYRDNDYNP